VADPTGVEVLDTPMADGNDADADTVREYLAALLEELWRAGDDFSPKRPFGTGGWQDQVYAALARAGHIDSRFDSGGWLEWADRDHGDDLISSAIEALRTGDCAHV
jgi:hypothetical protein